MTTWRTIAARHLCPIEEQVKALIASGNLKGARRLVRDAYPFGERAMHPYKIWCDQVAKMFPEISKAKPKPRKPEKEPIPETGTPLPFEE